MKINDNWTIETFTATGRFRGLRAHEYAADAWAAAAGAHGAFAPRHIAAALGEQEDPDIIAAVIEGTARALAEHDPERSPIEPRGCDVEIRGGRAVAIVWRSEGHTVALRSDFDWIVDIDCGANPMRSPRVWAALLDVPDLELEFHSDSGAVCPVEHVDDAWPIPGVAVDGVEGTHEHDRDIMLCQLEGKGALVVRGVDPEPEMTPPPIDVDADGGPLVELRSRRGGVA